MDWTSLIGPILQTGAGVYGAEKSKDIAQNAAQMAAINPYGVSSPFGGVSVNGRNLTLTPSDNPFGQLATQLGTAGLANYGYTQNDPYAALPDQYRQSGANTDAAFGTAYDQSQGQANNFYSALSGLGADPQAAAQNRYNLLTQAAQPEQNRMFNGLQDKLFSQGRLGTSGGGEAFRGFFEAQNQADLSRQMAGQDFAMNQQNQLANLATNFSNTALDRAQRRYGIAGDLLGQADMRRQNMFNNGITANNTYQQMFNPLISAAQLGISAGGGNPAGAQIVNQAGQAANSGYVQAGSQLFQGLGSQLGTYINNRNAPNAGSGAAGNAALNGAGFGAGWSTPQLAYSS